MRAALGSALLLACALAAGCGGTGMPPELEPIFTGDAQQTVTSANGAVELALRAWPTPAVRGQNAVELRVVRGPDGAAVREVTPWMPAHGHGSSVQPATTPADPGVFVVAPLYLFMAGRWELHIALGSADGDDSATATLDIP